MTARDPLLDFTLGVSFLSFLAIGGANAVIPELHRLSVDSGWMSDGMFADLFAIAQVTPGPNVILVTLIGWYVAGFAGASAGTVLMCVPAGICACFMSTLSTRFQASRVRTAIQRGLAALTVGVVLASAYILMGAADNSAFAYALTGAAALASVLLRANPLVYLLIGGAAGAFGLV